jgi:pimeloyl-ACP methyl ester carboxylesterase
VTTSLLGYGGTAERRTPDDASIAHEADMLEAVIRRTGSRVHLVGHSFGAMVALAVALRQRTPIASLVIIEPPAMDLLREMGEQRHYDAFGRMTEHYFAAFRSGDAEAIAAMIDFYGGPGTFASWPPRVRAYAIQTTAVNILDWTTAYDFRLSAAALSAVKIPTLAVYGEASHPAMQRICSLLCQCMSQAEAAVIDGAAHFMMAAHPTQLSGLIARHVRAAEAEAHAPAIDK